MRKKALVYIITAAIIFIPVFTAVFSANEGKEPAQNGNISGGYQSSAYPMYIMKEYNGHVAVFRFGNSHPCEILKTLLSDLPAQDIQALKAGIVVYSDEELQRRIEDYDS